MASTAVLTAPAIGALVALGPGEVFVALIVIGLPVMMLGYAFHRFFSYREKQLHVEAGLAAEKAAQYAARTNELEQRVRVLEQIVTDGGAQTAMQIEALRESKRIENGEKVR